MSKIKWLVPLVVAVVLVGCYKTTAPTSTSTSTQATDAGSLTTPLSGTTTISIQNFAYHPNTLVVKKGTILQITNTDIASHTLTADDGSFDTPVISKDKTASITLDKVGTFKFHCTIHPTQMTGTITVVE